MKNNVLSKHTPRAVICAIAFLVSLITLICALPINTPASEGATLDYDMMGDQPCLEIVASNLEYSEVPRLYHAVAAPALSEEEIRGVRMLVWTEPQESYTKSNANIAYTLKPDVLSYDISLYGEAVTGCILFRTEQIMPQHIIDTYYYRAYVTVDGVDYYSEVSKYSILDYLYSRFETLAKAPETNDPEILAQRENQMNLYNAFIEYASEAQIELGYKTETLASSDFVRITLDGAKFEDGFTKATLPIGATVTVVPTDKSQDAYAILAPNGNKVASSLTFTVTESFTSGTYTVSASTTSLNIVGAVANGKDTGKVSYLVGEEITLRANTASGSYTSFYWSIGGKIKVADPSEEIRYTVPASESEIVIEAVYSSAPIGATFDDLTSLKTNTTSSGQPLEFTTVSRSFFLTSDPTDPTNKVLRIHKTENGTGTGVGLYAPAVGSGKNTFVSFDMYIADIANSDILVQLDIETSYRIEFRNGNYFIYFTDLHEDGSLRNEFTVECLRGGWNSFRLEYYPTTVKGEDGKNEVGCTVVFYINGEPVSVSTNSYKEAKATPGKLRFWAMNDSRLDLYLDNYSYYRTDESNLAEAQKTAPVYGIPTAEIMWEARYAKALRMYGEEVVAAIEHMTTSLFTPKMYEWLAGLYDPKTGAFYYSNSARDNFGYLPDIESTGQSGTLLGTFGASLSSVLSEEQKATLAAWAQSCQSNEDGYFYHPQWGTDIGAGRRSRDLGNFGSQVNSFGSTDYLFDHANYRLSAGKSSYAGSAETVQYKVEQALTASLTASTAQLVSKVILAADASSMPAQFASKEAFIAYLDNMWESNKSIGKSYSIGHNITSQNSQIIAAGLAETCIEWLNSRQEAAQQILRKAGRPLTGLWEAGGVYELDDPTLGSYYKKSRFLSDVDGDGEMESIVPDVNYTFVSGLLKISGCYNSLGAEMPYAKEALNSAITMMKAPAEEYAALGESIVSVYNPPNATSNIMSNISKYGDVNVRLEAAAALAENALEIIKTTEAKIAIYRKDDGSFSYSPKSSASHSQGEPAAVPSTDEGDVNGTALAIGARRAMLSVLGLGDIKVMPTHAVDINGDGIVGENETHINRFKELISSKVTTAKKDTVSVGGSYVFDENSDPPRNSASEDTPHVVEVRNDGLYIKDNMTNKGLSVYFDSASEVSDERAFHYSADIKYESNAKGFSVQLYVGPLKLQFCVSNDYLEFQGRSTDDKSQENAKTFGDLKAYEWFNLTVNVFPDGKVVNGTTYYAAITVKQGNKVYEEYYKDFANGDISTKTYTNAYIYTLMGSTPGLYVNNVKAVNYGVISLNGWYDFDRNSVAQRPEAYGIIGGEIVDDGDPKTEKNNLLAFGKNISSSVKLNSAIASGCHNFAELQLTMYLKNARNGDSTTVTMRDANGNKITKLLISVTRNEGERDGILTVSCVKSAQVLITLAVDFESAFTLRLEYHYAKARLDVVARYTAAANQSGKRLADARAVSVSGFATHDADASAEDFATVTVTTNISLVYIDDLFARSVRK